MTAPYNPYATTKANHYKVQLHCHTNNSDGVDTPLALVNAYKAAGYGAVAITDHDVITADPNVADITFISATEESVTEGHFVCLNITERETSTDTQDVINTIVLAGGFGMCAHPDYVGSSWDLAEITALTGNFLMEIFGAQNIESDAKWDTVLMAGKMYFGTAVDDTHNSAGVFDNGYIVVHADNHGDILTSIQAGNFYASNGADVSIVYNGTTIVANTTNAATIEFIADGEVAQTEVNATSDTYTVLGTETYVRVRITRDSDGKKAWSNPIWF